MAQKFTDIQNKLGLKKFLASPLGTLYFIPFSPGAPRLIVRHFDSDLPPAFVKHYVDLVRALHNWIEVHPELASLVRIEQITDVGEDFISRPHHTYYVSTRSYEEDDDPPEPPEELEQMRSTFRKIIGQSNDPRTVIIESILAKSLLQPTGKTFFEGKEEKFIVVDPVLGKKDIEDWFKLDE